MNNDKLSYDLAVLNFNNLFKQNVIDIDEDLRHNFHKNKSKFIQQI